MAGDRSTSDDYFYLTSTAGVVFAKLVPNSKVLPVRAFSGSSIRKNVAALEKFVTDRVTVKCPIEESDKEIMAIGGKKAISFNRIEAFH